MRRINVTLSLLVAMLALFGASDPGSRQAVAGPAAATRAPTIPDAPIKCPGSCYGWQFGPEYMDNTYLGELTVSPKVVRPGQTVSVEAIPDPEYGAKPDNIDNCGDKERCTFKPTSGSGGWVRLNGYFCHSLACGIEQDAYYVLPDDEYAISGRVVDAKGEGVKGVRVDISPGVYAVTENTDGFYQAVLKKGTYTVSAPDGYCVKGSRPCVTSKKVVLTSTAAVDFQPPPSHTISGTIHSRTCGVRRCELKPVSGVTIKALSQDHTGTAVSDQDGRYQIKGLEEGRYVVRAKKGTLSGFDPLEYDFKLDGDEKGVDFTRCDDDSAGVAREEKAKCKVLITGHVRDFDFRPIPGRRIAAYASPGLKRVELHGRALTGPDGFFRMKVPRGTYLLTMVEDYEGEWEVEAIGDVRNVDLRPWPAVQLRSPSELGVLVVLKNAPIEGGKLTASLQGYPTHPRPGCTHQASIVISNTPDTPTVTFKFGVGGVLKDPLCPRRFLAKVMWKGEVLGQRRFDIEEQD